MSTSPVITAQDNPVKMKKVLDDKIKELKKQITQTVNTVYNSGNESWKVYDNLADLYYIIEDTTNQLIRKELNR